MCATLCVWFRRARPQTLTSDGRRAHARAPGLRRSCVLAVRWINGVREVAPPSREVERPVPPHAALAGPRGRQWPPGDSSPKECPDANRSLPSAKVGTASEAHSPVETRSRSCVCVTSLRCRLLAQLAYDHSNFGSFLHPCMHTCMVNEFETARSRAHVHAERDIRSSSGTGGRTGMGAHAAVQVIKQQLYKAAALSCWPSQRTCS